MVDNLVRAVGLREGLGEIGRLSGDNNKAAELQKTSDLLTKLIEQIAPLPDSEKKKPKI
jgi:hypothetical protein